MSPQIPDKFKDRYSPLVDDWDAFASTLLTQTPKSFRVNTLKASAPEVKKRIESYGIAVRQTEWYPEAFVSENPFVSQALEHFLGHIYMQDLTSMLPPLIVKKELKQAELVLDTCAAPGSKTTQAAAFMENRGTIVANDLSYERIRALKFNLEKNGVLNTIITNQDLRFFKGGNKLQFDAIVLDVPCSSEGTVRKNPALLSRWSEQAIRSTSGIQKRLLLKAFEMLKPGGVLVYSTCTFAPEENEEVVSALLSSTNGRLEQVRIPGFRTSPGIEEWKGKKFGKEMENVARVWPHHNNTDGFFLAKVRK